MKEKKIAVVCIVLALALIAIFIIPQVINHYKIASNYYNHESYNIINSDDLYNKEEFYHMITNVEDYMLLFSNNDLKIDSESLANIKEKDYKKYNYIAVLVPTNSCGETIEFEKAEIDTKNKEIILNFYAELSCGICAKEYELHEIAVAKRINKEYSIEIKWNYEKEDCDPEIAYKPILYLYPKVKTNIKVNFSNENNLTTTYPKFNKEWDITAYPNGDLYDKNNNYYYALYWEEKDYNKINFNEGFYVSKNNAIEFLEEKLTILGLTPKEKNEFIMYWLPILEKNEHNLIYFELTDELQKENELIINPKPDTLIRIRMHVKKVNQITKIKEQKLTIQKRVGYTAIEWGGVIHN